MPKQEVFFEQETDKGRIEVLKVYDRAYARQAFGSMDEAARKFLWNSLGINENYDATDLPPIGDPASEDFLWEELLEDGTCFRSSSSMSTPKADAVVPVGIA